MEIIELYLNNILAMFNILQVRGHSHNSRNFEIFAFKNLRLIVNNFET